MRNLSRAFRPAIGSAAIDGSPVPSSARVDQVVVYSRHYTRLESTGPVGLAQLTAKSGLAMRYCSACKEAILNVTRQEGAVLQVGERPSVGIQQPLYPFDNVSPLEEEPL